MSLAALDANFDLSLGRGTGTFSLSAELKLDGGILVLFGPSGAGKTVCLRVLAGLLSPDRGRICIGESTVVDTARGVSIAANRRRIGYVPQHNGLFPFLSVYGNVAFGLPRSGRGPGNTKVVKLLDELGLGGRADSPVASLSGGERQRVALARALAPEPRLLLLDEPFVSVDNRGRADLHEVLRQALAAHNLPAVFVTHDPIEALQLADRVVMFERGKTVRSGAAEDMLGNSTGISTSVAIDGVPNDQGDGTVIVNVAKAEVRAPSSSIWRGKYGRLYLQI